jgi:hypothetical protein
MTYPAVIMLGLVLWSVFWPIEYIVMLVFGSIAFGALAIIPPDLVFGFNLMPSAAASVVLIGRSLVDRKTLGGLARSAFALQGAGFLTLFWIIATASALFYPRLMEGVADVIPMRGAGPIPNGPNSANFTQWAYVTVSYLVALIIQYRMREERFNDAFVTALLIGGGVLAITGIADFVLGAAQTPFFAPYKTAQYAFLDGSETFGLRRVEGLMSEASAYGPPCVVVAAFLLLSSSGLKTVFKRFAAQVIGWILIGCAVVSTSSTAIVGLMIFVVVYFGGLMLRVGKRRERDPLLIWETAFSLLAVGVVAVMLMALPGLFDVPLAFVNATVINKTATASYVDRMTWNTLALQGLWATKGLGLGVGGARASSWAVSIISNTGVFGGVAMALFYGLQFIKPSLPLASSRTLAPACKGALAVSIITACLSVTSPDLGILSAGLAGVLVANTKPLGRGRPVPRSFGYGAAARA